MTTTTSTAKSARTEKNPVQPIRDRSALTDHISDVMAEAHRSLSIDQLLTRPFEAVEMAIEVGIVSERISKATARRLNRALSNIVEADPDAIVAINEILRCALSSRKRGDLRSGGRRN